MRDYWFRNKRVGIGWTPANWKGWLATGIYSAAVVGFTMYTTGTIQSDIEVIRKILLPLGALTFLLLVIIWRTGEPLNWRMTKRK